MHHIVVLTLMQLRAMVRVARRKSRLAAAQKPANRLAAFRTKLTERIWLVIHELIAPLFILVYAPIQAYRSWTALVRIDLYAWMLGYALLLSVTFAVRLFRLGIMDYLPDRPRLALRSI